MHRAVERQSRWRRLPIPVPLRRLRPLTERLADAEAVASVGSRGDSYANALAEAYNSLFKGELIRNPRCGPWKSINDVEIAVTEYVDWFNQRRLHGELDHIPPAEYEAAYRTQQYDHRAVPIEARTT